MEKTSQKEFTITRVVDAPRDLVWNAWTEGERLGQWWGPIGSKIEVAKCEVQPGGIFHYSLQMPDGSMMWGKFVYQEVAAPEKLVYVSSFSDEAGNVTRAPFNKLFPLELKNTLTFEESDGKTTITLRGGPVNATAEEQAFYEGMFSSMQQGFSGTFDQLDAYLEKQK